MAGPSARKMPIETVFLLDTGLNTRYFTSVTALAAAICKRYATSDAPSAARRPPSLRLFDAGGITDLSAFMDLPVPDNTRVITSVWVTKATPEQLERNAREQEEYQRLEKRDRRIVKARLMAYIDAAQSGLPLPEPDPWAHPDALASAAMAGEV